MKIRSLVAIIPALLLALGGCSNSNSSSTAADTSVSAESSADSSQAVSESETKAESSGVKKIKVAHTQSYYPYDFVNDKGESDGYEVAVFKAIDEMLPDYEFEYISTTAEDLLIGLEAGKYDVGIKGVWWTAEREEKFIYPENYIGSSVIGIAFRTENADKIKDLESFARFSGNLVPISPQSAQYTIIENFNKEHPDTPIKLTPADQFELSDAYQWVLEGRYDAFFNIKVSFDANVVAEDGEYHQFADKLSFATYKGIPIWPLFNKEKADLAKACDEAVAKLKEEGKLESLSEQYFGYSIFKDIPEGYKKGDDL